MKKTGLFFGVSRVTFAWLRANASAAPSHAVPEPASPVFVDIFGGGLFAVRRMFMI